MFGNTITIIGNLTRDPELRYIQNGTALTKLGIAWNYRAPRSDTEKVSFFDVTCWGELGENIANSNLAKGSRVVVVGRIDQNSYETKDGQKRSAVQIIADEVSPSLRWATVDVTRIGSAGNSAGGNGASGNGEGGSQTRPETSDSQVESKPQGTENSELVESGVSASENIGYDEEPF